MISDDVPYPDTVDALAEVLRRDHVLVHQTLGSGDTDGALDRIGRLVAEIPFATYVAVVEAPDDVDAGNDTGRFLATALSRRIGEPGLYVVKTSDGPMGYRIVGTGWDETIFSLQASTDGDAVEAGSGDPVLAPTVEVESMLQTAAASTPRPSGSAYDEVSLDDDVVDDLVDRERSLTPYERPDLADDAFSGPWTTGKRWMVGSLVGAGTLLVLLQSLRGWPGWRRRRRTSRPHGQAPVRRGRPATTRPPVPTLARVREDAESELTALAESLPTAPAGEHLDRATLAREVAEPLLDSSDLLDVVGALVLARAGRREVSIALGRARRPVRTCFFDPRHPSATAQAEWRFGDTDVEVPVCRRCRDRLAGGREPDSLTVGRRRRQRPYYEGDSVWARTGFGSLTTDLADLATQVAAERGRR